MIKLNSITNEFLRAFVSYICEAHKHIFSVIMFLAFPVNRCDYSIFSIGQLWGSCWKERPRTQWRTAPTVLTVDSVSHHIWLICEQKKHRKTRNHSRNHLQVNMRKCMIGIGGELWWLSAQQKNYCKEETNVDVDSNAHSDRVKLRFRLE